jgi:tetratricopeptide (TPR) repeat protein
MAAEILYRAFLSYSHSDRGLAAWLHRTLESYRVPSKLVGTSTQLGRVPARLTPIFRDREELSAAGNLGEAIEAALAQSSALIVICSPDAAKSRWVNEEIRCFKRFHGEQRTFAVIVAGEPGASDMAGREAEECFPEALRFKVRLDGTVTKARTEPIATDFRSTGDGRRLGKLKLVSGLLGLRLDALVQRETQRRQRRLAYITAASIAGMASASGLAIAANQARQEAQLQRNEAQRQRAEADGLIEFMLTDLRGKLEPVGRLDVLKSVGDRALDYYARQKLSDLDGNSLGRRARAMLLVAEVSDLQGNSEAARRGFVEAARSTAELLKRDPNNWQRAYDHAQSEFWLAYDAHNRGDNRAALPHFLAYRDLSRRLMQLAPDKTESRVELASAEVNLGVALVAENKLKEAIPSFEQASVMFENIRPRTREIALNLNQALGHEASALYGLGDNFRALETRREQLSTLRSEPLSDDDREVQEASAVVLGQMGITFLTQGDVRASRRPLHQAIDRWNDLVRLDPANRMWRGELNTARMWSAVALSATNLAAARNEMASVIADQRRLIATKSDWVHKMNLLRMISFDRALGGQSKPANEPLVAEAWSRRDRLNGGERGILAAVLISEGDGMISSDNRQARTLWRGASELLNDDSPSTWTLIHRARTQRRLGQRSTIARIPPNAFAGVFAEDAGP